MSTATERIGMSFAAIRAGLPAGELLSEVRPDGTLVLRRPDFSVGTVPDAEYVTKPGNAVTMRTLTASAADAVAEVAAIAAASLQNGLDPLRFSAMARADLADGWRADLVALGAAPPERYVDLLRWCEDLAGERAAKAA